MKRLIILVVAALAVTLAVFLLGAQMDQAEADETVALLAGCNPVASTWPDGTAVVTVAEAVSPPEALESIWRFDPYDMVFRGFSPTAPTYAVDLHTVDFLDAVFVCVNMAATITRPPVLQPGTLSPSGPTGVEQQPPLPPNRFYGGAVLDGEPAAEGTAVTATIGGTLCGAAFVRPDGNYMLDVSDSALMSGCGTHGATVEFFVAGCPAGTESWQSGYFTPLDLFGSCDIPTPTPTDTPTATPSPWPGEFHAHHACRQKETGQLRDTGVDVDEGEATCRPGWEAIQILVRH